ncbi:MAG: Iron-sulfur flavoprotein [ANME-2 cluster archaeon]|nr:Iron-sulfur flavoprotein [ANME-2 cluster archaeon]
MLFFESQDQLEVREHYRYILYSTKDPDILRNKVGAALAVGGDRVDGQEIAIQSIHHFYIFSEMILV